MQTTSMRLYATQIHRKKYIVHRGKCYYKLLTIKENKWTNAFSFTNRGTCQEHKALFKSKLNMALPEAGNGQSTQTAASNSRRKQA